MSPLKLRELLRKPGLIQSLAAHDVFTALLIEQAGFECVFLGGFGASASMLGLPDLNFLTVTEMADAIRRTAARVRIPIIADGDTGHGAAHQVRRTVELFEQAGAAGILLEDQVYPKRCGHFANKSVVPLEEMLERIDTAVGARRNPDFVIIARTDARQPNGFEDAIQRVNRCCEAGADVAFVEAPQTEAELAEFPRRVRWPCLANMLSGGVTPIRSARELEEMGYKFAVCPIETLLVTATAVRRLCETFRRDGRVDEAIRDGISFAELKRLLGVEEFLASGNDSNRAEK